MIRFYMLSLLMLMGSISMAHDKTGELFPGKWYFPGLVTPTVSDTFRQSRGKIHDSSILLEFRENGSFCEQGITEILPGGNRNDSMISISSNTGSRWKFNMKMQTVELKDLDGIYRITATDSGFLELVRLN